jgi:hypothetical protein
MIHTIFFAMYDTYLLKVLILAVLDIFTHEGRLANRGEYILLLRTILVTY